MFDPEMPEDKSGLAEEIKCPDCHGSGGWDAAKDCEVYDDWQDCGTCLGLGMIEED